MDWWRTIEFVTWGALMGGWLSLLSYLGRYYQRMRKAERKAHVALQISAAIMGLDTRPTMVAAETCADLHDWVDDVCIPVKDITVGFVPVEGVVPNDTQTWRV